jgi:hypothetical protein
MAVNWRRIPARSSALPFNGDQVLLAVPNIIGASYGGEGIAVDPASPFWFHVGRWDHEQQRWATSAADDETGTILWVGAAVPAFWAELEPPL